MSELAPPLKHRFFDSNGDPLAGGKLYSYVGGTSTPQSTYTDQTGVTANANPIILDANGEANVWMATGVYYKFVLKDANDVTQWTQDNVYIPTVGGASAGNAIHSNAGGGTITLLPSTDNVQIITGSGATTIESMTAPSSVAKITIHNDTDSVVTIKHENAGSTAANRFYLPGTADAKLSVSQSLEFFYDTGDARWKQIGESLQTSSAISDFTEASQDAVGAMVDTTLVYVDGTPLLTRAALTGDVTAAQGSNATTIANDAVTNAKLANMATATFKGRTTAGIGDPEDLTATQATALLNSVVGDSGSGGTKGLVPAPASGDAAANKYLKASGSWSSIASGDLPDNGVTNAKLADVATATFKGRTTAGTGDPEDLTATQATALLNNFVGDSGSGGTKGLVPAPASGDAAAGKFLKANGSWAAPSLSSSYTAPKITTYTSGSGTHTFTGSPLFVRVRMVGGGGGGAGSATTAANNGGAGGDGGQSTFAGLLTANGGVKGTAGGTPGGVGGTASLGAGPTGIARQGGAGGPGSYHGATSVYAPGGQGGATPFGGAGGGGGGGTNSIVAVIANTGSGGGGGGGPNTGVSGSGGGAGGFIDAIISGATLSALSGSASYAVGAAGTAGAAGTSGSAGGAGSAGFIEVTEYYQ